MRAQQRWASFALIVVCGFAGGARADVVLNTGGTTILNLGARDTNVSSTTATDDSNPFSIPYDDARLVFQGASSSVSTYSFSDSAFDITMSHTRAGLLDSGAVSQGFVFFSVTVDTLYNIDGQYAAIDPDPRAVILDASIDDLTLGTTLFKSRQASSQTANEIFFLGETGGDAENVLSGSTTGTLLAGHQYRFTYQGQTYAHFTDDGASAAGSVSLRFEPSTPTPPVVPIPAAVYGGAVLLGGLALSKTRRRGQTTSDIDL